MKIKIARKVFEIHFLHEKDYIDFYKDYLVDEGEVDFYIYQDLYSEEVNKGEKRIDSILYDLYEKDGIDYQYQKSNSEGIYIGKICYDEKNTIFACKDIDDKDTANTLIKYIVTRYLMHNEQCILVKSNVISYNGQGILITSGEPSSIDLFSDLWKKYYDIIHVSDYTNFIVKIDDKIYAFGHPWSKNRELSNNIYVLIKMILFVNQNTNSLIKLEKRDAFLKISNLVVTPQEEQGVKTWNEMVDSLMNVPSYSCSYTFDKSIIDLVVSKL